MLGFAPLATLPLSVLVQSAAAAVVVTPGTGQTPAGAPGASGRRRRFEVEWRGQVHSFATAEQAYDWLRQIAEEQAREQTPGISVRKRAIVVKRSKPIVRYDGVNVSSEQFHKQPIVDYLLAGERLRFLSDWLARRADEDEDAAAMLLLH